MREAETRQIYSAKSGYLESCSATEYENRPYYTGLLGKYRCEREKRVVAKMLSRLDGESVVLDCPCGNGRWFKYLRVKAGKLVAIDISGAMVEFAGARARGDIGISVVKGDGEHLPLPDKGVDYVFCFALMKHLPPAAKQKILLEFSRVSRKGVICSFAILNPLAYVRWKVMNKDPESYVIWPRELKQLTNTVGLSVLGMSRITGVLGLESMCFMSVDR